jgi:hypothetical protein
LAFFFAFFSLAESFFPLFCFLGDLSAMSVHLRPARLVWPPKRVREPIGGGPSDIRIAQWSLPFCGRRRESVMRKQPDAFCVALRAASIPASARREMTLRR